MFDTWVEKVKTKECWRLDHDSTKEVYLDDEGHTQFKDMRVWDYKFYPCCPREAPKLVDDNDYEQTTIFDFMED